MFRNLSKVVLCGRRNALQFSWQAQHFGRVYLHFAWQRSTLDVSCCVFLQIALAVLRQVATRCKFRGSRGILCDVLKIDGRLARNIDFDVANFQILRKTRRKTSILKLQSVKIGGSLARNARFGAPTCRVSRVWFSRGLAVSMGEAAKPILFEGVKSGCNFVLRRRRGTFASFSEDESHVLWQAQHFGVLHRHFAWQAQHLVKICRVWNALLHGRRNISDTLHFTLHTLHLTLYTLHSGL